MSSSLVVLHSVLGETELSLQIWSQLKLDYFPVEYQPVFRALSQFYTSHGKLPSKSELTLALTRSISESPIYGLFLSFEPPEDIDALVALKVLVDEYIQESALDKLEKLVTKISEYSGEEVIDKIANIAYDLESSSDVQSTMYSVQDIELFGQDPKVSYIPLGLNNNMDNNIIGVARSETILIGGRRGSGKSIVCSNLVVNEYLNGYTSAYFTIEMRAAQVHRRNIGIEAGISSVSLRNGNLTHEEKAKVAETLCRKYTDSGKVLSSFYEHNDLHKLEIELKKCTLNKDNQIIIIDSPHLSLVDIDTTLARLKATYGKKLRMVAVDYVNQIQITDKFDWQSQITISSTLKELAAKHDVAIAAPYQIDATGEARFSKGILDSADYAIILEASQDEKCPYIKFETTKARDVPPFSVCSNMDWKTLRILPTEAILDSGDESNEEHDDL